LAVSMAVEGWGVEKAAAADSETVGKKVVSKEEGRAERAEQEASGRCALRRGLLDTRIVCRGRT